MIETVEERTTSGAKRQAPRRVRARIRRVNPWSVLKVSLILYFCLMLVALLGFAILYMILDSIGIIAPIEQLIGSVGFGQSQGTGEGAVSVFEINFGYLMRTIFLIGIVSTAVWAVFTLFVALLYNLISDLVGGVEVTLVERR